MSLEGMVYINDAITLIEIQLTTSLVIGTDCIGSLKFNYHTIMTTTAPGQFWSIQEFSNFSNDGHLGWSLDRYILKW
jgi:hypothetical protein